MRDVHDNKCCVRGIAPPHWSINVLFDLRYLLIIGTIIGIDVREIRNDRQLRTFSYTNMLAPKVSIQPRS